MKRIVKRIGWLKIYLDKEIESSPWYLLSFAIPVTPHRDSDGEIGMWLAYHNPHHSVYSTPLELGIYFGRYLVTISRKRIRFCDHHATAGMGA